MNELARSRDRTRHVMRQVERKAARKLRARRSGRYGLWLGLKIAGLVGWSVVLPILFGVAAGNWLDSRFPGQISWTLTLLFAGLALGCFGAWTWIERERSRIRDIDKDGPQ